jgi:hypothetical protein
MPRKEKHDELSEMEDWIEFGLGLRATTARIYKYHVRAALRVITLDRITEPQAIADYFDNLYYDDPLKHSNHKRAWGVYVEWMAKEKDVEVVPVANAKSRVEQGASELPSELALVLVGLIPKPLKLKEIPNLCWWQVDASSSTAMPRITAVDGGLIAISHADLAVLKAWAQGGHSDVGRDQPLVPTEPGGMKAHNVRSLSRALRKARAGAFQDHQRLDVPTRRAVLGSALQTPPAPQAEAALPTKPDQEPWESRADQDILGEIVARGKAHPPGWEHIGYDEAEATMRRVRVAPGGLHGKEMPPGITESNLSISRARLYLVPLEVEVITDVPEAVEAVEVIERKEKKEEKKRVHAFDGLDDMSADELRELLRTSRAQN